MWNTAHNASLLLLLQQLVAAIVDLSNCTWACTKSISD